jgi:hypothetical protein
MQHVYKLSSLLLLLFWTTVGFAQISFSDSTHLLSQTDFSSGVAVAVVDMNNDGLDDIVRLEDAQNLNIEYQQADGSFVNFSWGQISESNEWAIWIADVDNDGKNDILAAGSYNQTKLLKQIAPDNFEMQMLPGPNHFAQGSNAADINNDGYIDIFSCHDDAESRIWANDRNGNFRMADDWIDMRTTPNSDNSGNYGSIWTDFDNDGDIDLYIAKCRLGVNSQTDPRRINALFVNDGRGNYTEMAEEYGLKFGYQSWTSDFQDIDNDGDLDCFITNHDYSVQLLENDGTGHFTDISSQAGLNFSGFILQGLLRDFDNDGYVDILTSGVEKYFHNNGDKTFTEVDSPFGMNELKSIALGDLNHDGFVDVYGTHHNSYNNPTNQDDDVWLNDGNDNHFLVITLSGKTSNQNGVGAKLELYGPWGIQTREVRSGESYGIMNSFKQHFGLSTETVADSLIVKWPSGSVDVFYDLSADQFLTLEENSGCTAAQPQIETPTANFFCPDSEYELNASGGSFYVWSTGDTIEVLALESAGIYNVTNHEGNCAVASDYVIIEAEPDLSPLLELDGFSTICDGEAVMLIASESPNYLWSTGDTTQSIMVEAAGIYSVSSLGDCGEYPSEAIEINVLTPQIPEVETDTLAGDGVATLTAVGENPHWYDSDTSTVALAIGDTFVTPELSGTDTFYVEDVLQSVSEEVATGIISHFGNQFSSNIYNGETYFNSLTHITINQVRVYTDEAGLRIIELKDADDNIMDTYDADLPGPGTYLLDLNFDVPPGEDYVLTTNTAQNNILFGFNSPRLRRNNEGVSYPYVVDEVIEITGSNLGQEYYYYFYDWKVKPQAVSCPSERIPVEVVVELIIDGTAEATTELGIKLYPNPTADILTVEIPALAQERVHISVIDALGKSYLEQLSNRQSVSELNLGHLPKGMYTIRFEIDGEYYFSKIILQ